MPSLPQFKNLQFSGYRGKVRLLGLTRKITSATNSLHVFAGRCQSCARVAGLMHHPAAVRSLLMSPEIVTSVSLWEILKHTAAWLRNLSRASKNRKLESTAAVREVVLASRKTAVYLRRLRESGQRSHETELELAMIWTELGFKLNDLGLTALAKRCDIKGRHWSDPGQFDDDFLEKADVSLETMERLARSIQSELA